MQIFQVPNGPLTIERNGKKYIAEEWQKTFSDLFQQLQRELGPELFLIPQQPSTTVDTKTGMVNLGALMYDTTRSAFVGNINGALYTFNVTAI